jgi:hypothetical protein
VQGLSRKSRKYAGTVGTVRRTVLGVRGSSKLCEKNGMKWDEKCRQGAVDSGDGHASSGGMWMVRKMLVERELKRGGIIRTKRQSEANREGRAQGMASSANRRLNDISLSCKKHLKELRKPPPRSVHTTGRQVLVVQPRGEHKTMSRPMTAQSPAKGISGCHRHNPISSNQRRHPFKCTIVHTLGVQVHNPQCKTHEAGGPSK